MRGRPGALAKTSRLFRCWHEKPARVLGRAGPLCPRSSDVDFFGDLKGIVDFDTNGAFNFRMTQQELHRAQVAGPAIDQRRLGSPQGMRGELAWFETDAADPLGYEPSILPRAQGPVRVSAAWEQVLASFVLRHAKVVVEGLSRSLS